MALYLAICLFQDITLIAMVHARRGSMSSLKPLIYAKNLVVSYMAEIQSNGRY